MRRENNLGEDPIGRLVLRIALPSMLAQFVNVLYSIVDRMYIGNIPNTGDLALAGLGVCGPVVTLIGSVASLIGIGGAPLMSISMGGQDIKRAKRVLANSFLMLTVLSVAITAALYPIREPMLLFFGASEATMPFANEYFSIYLFGTLFALLSAGMNQFIICQGYAKVAMFTVVTGAITNILLDPVFIFLLDLGVAGAALATVFSQVVSCCLVIGFLFSKKPAVSISFGGYDLRIMGRIFAIGFTPFAIIAVDNVMIIAMNTILQNMAAPNREICWLPVPPLRRASCWLSQCRWGESAEAHRPYSAITTARAKSPECNKRRKRFSFCAWSITSL